SLEFELLDLEPFRHCFPFDAPVPVRQSARPSIPTHRHLMAAKIYTENDASLEPLRGKTCAVIGFGSQGHCHALNLKESGVNVIVGLYPESKSRKVAEERGFKVLNTGDAVKAA